jgi:dethiobiotin synthetase
MYFVTGTDTGAGKTFVSAAFLRRARELGKRAFGFKPIETGCTAGELGPDQAVLCEAAGGWQEGSLCGLYRLRDPVAPLVAAQVEGIELDLGLIVTTTREISATVGFSVVEGAGGWRVPITPNADMASLARQLGAPVIVAARAGLGTINHTLLTLEAVERDGCSVAAAILSRRPEDDVGFAEQNAAEVRRRWSGRVLVLGETRSALDPLL